MYDNSKWKTSGNQLHRGDCQSHSAEYSSEDSGLAFRFHTANSIHKTSAASITRGGKKKQPGHKIGL